MTFIRQTRDCSNLNSPTSYISVTAKNSTGLPLPPELLLDIVQLLPLPDQRSLSLTSHLHRKLTLPFIFGHLRYTEKVLTKICNIHLAGKDVKASITKLELMSRYTPGNLRDDERNILFQFLESLPNLLSFILIQAYHLVRPTDLPKLIAALYHAPLLEFYLDNGITANVEGQPVIGLSGLETFSVIWNRRDHDEPGSAHDHLYNLIRPSLSTLVNLRIDDYFPEFDLQLLKPAGKTLRSFRYLGVVGDDQNKIFDYIPVLFPHLIKLDLRRSRYSDPRGSILWKDDHINILARNKNLTDLTLSSDFEIESKDIFNSDENFAWYVRSYKRRLKATQDVLSACEKLERCCWIQMNLRQRVDLKHSFIVEERVLDGKRTKVVRGLKQEWMGRDYDCLETGGIVKCMLEDLPGDIIGENDPPSDDDTY